MNRKDLQHLSRIRQREAKALLKAKHWAGSYYLMGYAVECAIKACIAKNTSRHDFPDKELALRAFTHDLESLMKLAGLSHALKTDITSAPALEVNWTIVKDWSEIARYKRGIKEAEAKDMYSACCIRANGILSWIRRNW